MLNVHYLHDQEDTPPPVPASAPIPEPAQPFPGEPEDQPAVQPPLIVPVSDPSPGGLPGAVPQETPIAASGIQSDLQTLGDMARSGIRYQAAFMELLNAYRSLSYATALALSHLKVEDLDDDKLTRAWVLEAVTAVERALQAQQPPRSSH